MSFVDISSQNLFELGNVRDKNRLKRRIEKLMSELTKSDYDPEDGITIAINGFVSLQGNRFFGDDLRRSMIDMHLIKLIRTIDECILSEYRTYENIECHQDEEVDNILNSFLTALQKQDIELIRCAGSNCKNLVGNKDKDLNCISCKYCKKCSELCCTREETCSICLDELEKESYWVMLKCRHVFHYHCISKVENTACPLCRLGYSDDDIKCW
jgi:hypothetical protein